MESIHTPSAGLVFFSNHAGHHTWLGVFALLFQRNFLYKQSTKSAFDLATTLSFSSASWVLADDVVGLQEVLRGATQTTDLKFAIVQTP